jgi:hypothetical protein
MVVRTKSALLVSCILLSLSSLFAQGKRVYVLRAGEMVEYDPATFAVKQTVKLPPEAAKTPANISVNRLGQILYAPAVSLPLSEEEAAAPHKLWIWNGKSAASIDQHVEHSSEEHGSNLAISESAPIVFLSADGNHLFWFANQPRRLQRENIDLTVVTTFRAWQTDLEGNNREELATTKLPECRCTTGTCEESCPSFVVWVPEGGVGNFFLTTQFVSGQTAAVYKASSRYQQDAGKWTEAAIAEPLQRVLDADANGSIVEAIPDTGCCGWSNQSNDQTEVLSNSKKVTVFDEQAAYKNSDYDVSFYTANARLSPESDSIAMTIAATAQANKPIQLAEDGQANPEESLRIRKALGELPVVEIKSLGDTPKRIAFVAHAALVGWISEKEVLLVEDHILVGYNVATGARRKSTVKVEDALHVFLR